VLLVRIIGFATAIALGVLVLMWTFTGERKWLVYGWRVFKYAVFVILLILLLLLGERLLEAL
jgi:hypothetical protein